MGLFKGIDAKLHEGELLTLDERVLLRETEPKEIRGVELVPVCDLCGCELTGVDERWRGICEYCWILELNEEPGERTPAPEFWKQGRMKRKLCGGSQLLDDGGRNGADEGEFAECDVAKRTTIDKAPEPLAPRQ